MPETNRIKVAANTKKSKSRQRQKRTLKDIVITPELFL